MGAEVSAEALQWYEGERAYRRQLVISPNHIVMISLYMSPIHLR